MHSAHVAKAAPLNPRRPGLPLLRAERKVPPRQQLLKWIGNKQRFAADIVGLFPEFTGTYIEPFIGSGAVLATLAPARAMAGDALGPLIALWQTLQTEPDRLIDWYATGWLKLQGGDKKACYNEIRAHYNLAPNAADLVVLARACYGGVIRFGQHGAMNTPCGAHRLISPASFAERVPQWRDRVAGTRFVHSDFEALVDGAQPGDLVYCDPPYSDCESTLYGAQAFSLARLMAAIARCKARGVRVALSIDGSKRSGGRICNVPIPDGLFATEASVDVGRSMLRRFQMLGQTLEDEVVADRLLLTW